MKWILKGKGLFLLLILMNIFSQIISSTTETFETNGKKEGYLSVQTSNNFVVYTVIGKDDSTNYIFSAYADSSRQKRIQLGQSVKGVTKLYLSIKDIPNKTLYWDLECSNYPCSGEIYYEYCQSFELIEGEPINYYVNQESEQISFLVKLSNVKLNIWARGEYEIKFEEIEDIPTVSNEIGNSGKIFLIDNENNYKSELTFRITPKKGDYINVGYIAFKANEDLYETVSAPIKIDGPTITGYLKKKILDTACYEIEDYSKLNLGILIGNGILFTKFGYSFLLTKDGKRLKTDDLYTSGYIRNGIIVTQDLNEQYKVCITFPDSENSKYSNIDEIVFTYQISNVEKKEAISNEPQLNGLLYPRTINQNSKVAYISQKNGQFQKMTLNLNSLMGFPKMYVVECETYPLCKMDDETLKNSIRPHNINRFSAYNVKKKDDFDESPISKKQTLFVVECLDIEKRGSSSMPKYMSYICDFNSLIYDDDKESVIELRDNKYFNQYALSKHEHKYKINLSKEPGIAKVFIDIMTYAGNIEVNKKEIEDKGITADQYDAINKIFLSVKIEGKIYDDISFSITALDNTYYTILVTYASSINDADSFITNNLQTGMAYLVTVDNTKKSEYDSANKFVKFTNERMYDQLPFGVNFYSLNCDINVAYSDSKGVEKPIEQFEHFSHDIITKDNDEYSQSPYEYKIRVKNPDPSQYTQNLCKVFVSSIEISDEHDNYIRDILIPDNIPQEFMFTMETKHISFGYIHVDFHNDLLIKFTLKHTAKYSVKLFYENHEGLTEKIVATNILHIKKKEWEQFCKDDSRVCYIQIDITLEQIKDNNKPVLELSVNSLASNFVDYIPKNQFKTDFIQNENSLYYYTEVGANEDGFILVNFLRGSGSVNARIVQKNYSGKEPSAEWKEKYDLPNKDNTLKIDPFTKKLKFSTLNECEKGCYLLMRVFSDVISTSVPFDKNFPFTIIISSYPRTVNYLNIPYIRIPVDEYIDGSIDEKKNAITEYYSVWLNSDADVVKIDFQADIGNIYINVGERKPVVETSVEQADFIFSNSGKDTLYQITKEEIRRKIVDKKLPYDFSKKGIRDVVLTIGVWTNNLDSIYTTTFSFAVRLANNTNNNFEIYRVNSDQKAICNPTKIANDKYRCLYVLDYDLIHQFPAAFVYATPEDKTASINIFGDIIEAENYEMGYSEDIISKIPNENSKFSTLKSNTDFLYFGQGTSINQYIFISVEINKYTPIELISTIALFQDSLSPNPSSPQLLSAFTNFEFRLELPKEYMEMVNIICVGGAGEIYWNDKTNKYYLKGRDDRLSLTSLEKEESHTLKIKATGELFSSIGIVFIIEYNIRTLESNFDPLNIYKSVNYVYSESDFPVVLYCPLEIFNIEKDEYYDVSVTFYNLETNENKRLTYYEKKPFVIEGYIVKESYIYDSKIEHQTTPIANDETIFGYYDHAVRTGLIRIKAENIKSSKITNEKPYLYLKLDKSPEFETVRQYKSVSFETTLFHKGSQIPISELSNQYGYLDVSQNDISYILRNDKSKKYMNLEFSAEFNKIEISLENLNLNLEQEKYGKRFYSIEVGSSKEFVELKIKRASNQDAKEVQFFLFKYTFSDQKLNSKYSIKDTSVKVTKTYRNNTSDYFIEVYPVNDQDKYNNVTYIARLIQDKKMPANPSVALKVGEQYVKEYYEPNLPGNKFRIIIYDSTYQCEYIQVIAQIIDKEEVVYLSYDLQNKFTENNKPKDKTNDNTNRPNNTGLIVAIIVGVILLIIVVVLIVIILTYNNKNKDLLEQVKKVSFAGNDQREEGEDLLLDKNK